MTFSDSKEIYERGTHSHGPSQDYHISKTCSRITDRSQEEITTIPPIYKGEFSQPTLHGTWFGIFDKKVMIETCKKINIHVAFLNIGYIRFLVKIC